MPANMMISGDKDLVVETAIRVYDMPAQSKWAVDFGTAKSAQLYDRVVKDTNHVYWSTERNRKARGSDPRAWDMTRGLLIVSTRNDEQGLTCVIQDRPALKADEKGIGFARGQSVIPLPVAG